MAEKINKLNCAKRQIETAISLFLDYGDEVSIHTLIAAAHKILFNKIGKSIIKNDVFNIPAFNKFSEKEKKRYFNEITGSENFFKHADKDPDGELEFDSKITEYFIFDAIRMYYLLSKKETDLMSKYNVWFYLNYPDLSPPIIKSTVDNLIQKGVNAKDRKYFLG